MATNDEIINEYGYEHDSIPVPKVLRLIEEREKQTAISIFKELDELVYVTGLSVKDTQADWFKEKYEAVKKSKRII